MPKAATSYEECRRYLIAYSAFSTESSEATTCHVPPATCQVTLIETEGPTVRSAGAPG